MVSCSEPFMMVYLKYASGTALTSSTRYNFSGTAGINAPIDITDCGKQKFVTLTTMFMDI
jgi:hypothetical protein